MTERVMDKQSLVWVVSVVAALSACKASTPPAAKSDETQLKAAETSGDKSGVIVEAKPKPPSEEGAAIAAPSDVAAPPADAQKTQSGLATKVLAPGKGGDKPSAYDKVTVHYTGWTTDGKMFDSSVQRGNPATFEVKGVIAGWTEGLQLMTAGEKRRLWIPEDLAYKGRPGSPQGMLVFDVELLEITKGQAPIEAPPDVAAAPADAQKTKSGLAHKLIAAGTGKDKPHAWDLVTVHYTGWTTDGKMFDSSLKRGEPAKFELNKVIAGWTEGVQLMSVGEKRRFWIPEELAYKGRPGAPQGMLVFDVQLLSIERKPEPPAAPKDVAAAPKDAKRTPSGIAYKVLKKGTGKTHPTAQNTVQVHYTGWTTDGKMFDSSVARGEPATFPLSGVIAGWTEGVQLMVEGEKLRLWIPEELAYKGRPGAPQGMLVFDVELLKIQQ
jgi:peptidylprolyl isomerase